MTSVAGNFRLLAQLRLIFRLFAFILVLAAALHGFSAAAAAQTGDGQLISVPRGQSQLITLPLAAARVSIGDPNIADAVVVSPREVLVNGRTIGTTTLIIWDANNARRTYRIEVSADASALQRQFQTLFPGQPITVTAAGNVVVLSGGVRDSRISTLALQLARATGATVVDNLDTPAPQQVLLQVRFAEVSRNALQQFRTELQLANPDLLGGATETGAETLSDGLVRLLLFGSETQLNLAIEAQRGRGEFRSLAEPNLLALAGSEASFLAGGEFPYPVVTGTGEDARITIVFKEFGVRLNFAPEITGAGNIRLRVAPEVSSLDFSNALRLSGFLIPSLLTRRAATEVELRDGQTFAIAGLMNNTILNNRSRVPILGDLPILGVFFRQRERRDTRTELLVLVTPRLVGPLDVPPPVPTGEPGTWNWDPAMIDRPTTAPPRP